MRSRITIGDMRGLQPGISPPRGPKAGSRVTVRLSDPPGAYPLHKGLRPGDIVILVNFDHNNWDVQRGSDGAPFQIHILNVGEVLTTPTPVKVPPPTDVKPDWRKILEAAREAQRRLDALPGGKPGERMRQVYADSFRNALALGYPGDDDDWEVFVRRRGML